MSDKSSYTGELTLADIIAPTRIDLRSVQILRHTLGNEELQTRADLTPENVLSYTRRQGVGNKLGPVPPPIWLVFIADGKRRARFFTTFDNKGEVESERTDKGRVFDLHRRHHPAFVRAFSFHIWRSG